MTPQLQGLKVNTNSITHVAAPPPFEIPSTPTPMPKVVAKRPAQVKAKPVPTAKIAKLAGKEMIKNAIA